MGNFGDKCLCNIVSLHMALPGWPQVCLLQISGVVSASVLILCSCPKGFSQDMQQAVTL